MGTVFLHGNGGSGGSGGGLSFQVIGNPKPKNPVEGVVWVNTDIDITGYFLSAEQPENLTEGNLWIKISDSSNVEIGTPLGKDYITIMLDSVSQYVDGNWVSAEAKSFQNGVWVDFWNGDLYDAGNEFEYITGGWVSTFDVISWNNNNVSEQAATKSGKLITLKASNVYSASPINTKNKIDVTPYKTLSVDITVKSGFVNLYLTNALSRVIGPGADNGWMVAAKESLSTGTVTVDLSGINENVYIVIYGIRGISSDSTAEATISRVNLR